METAFQYFPTTFEKNYQDGYDFFSGYFTGDSTGEFTGDSTGDSSQYDHDSSASDCESGVTGDSSTYSSSSSSASPCGPKPGVVPDEIAPELEEGDKAYEVISRRFIAAVGGKASVVSIRRRNMCEVSAQARVQTFQVYNKALETKHTGGPTNVKFGWYGGDSDTIARMLAHGFSFQDVRNNHNAAVFLSPADYPSPSVEESGADEDGLRHVLLCRVLLGRSEVVRPGSGQTHPSSNEFDSGVDNNEDPRKYIVWSTNMNTHILPEYVVTFKVHAAGGGQISSKGVGSKMKSNGIRMPTSPWISFPALISVLAKYLAPDAISLINKYHNAYKERKIMRPQLIEQVRQIAGDNLLIAVIKSYKCKTMERKMQFDVSKCRNKCTSKK